MGPRGPAGGRRRHRDGKRPPGSTNALWSTFLRRTSQATGLSTDELFERLNGARSTSARINRLHPDGGEAIRASIIGRFPALEPMTADPDALLATDDAPAHELIPWADRGEVYLQNASSLLPVLALDVHPGLRVLDVAAAPGGKAFNIAAKLAARDNPAAGELWLNDAIKPRADKLAALAALYHVHPTRVTMHKAQYIDKFLGEERFDRILVDAQCSGEGRFDLRKKSALRYWSMDRIADYTHQQTKMIDAAAKLLAPGGILVYSTCTIAPEENEAAVNRALRRRPELDVVPLSWPDVPLQPGLTRWEGVRFDPRLSGTARTVPDHRFEAFYVAALRRI
ncbi:MAG: hypothetical protein ACK5PP_04610 [Acidimicrobiales bacterium]